MSAELEKRVKDIRAALKDDLLGATYMELMLRLGAEEPDWIEACTYAFFMELNGLNSDAAKAFAAGMTVAVTEIIDKEEGRNG